LNFFGKIVEVNLLIISMREINQVMKENQINPGAHPSLEVDKLKISSERIILTMGKKCIFRGIEESKMLFYERRKLMKKMNRYPSSDRNDN